MKNKIAAELATDTRMISDKMYRVVESAREEIIPGTNKIGRRLLSVPVEEPKPCVNPPEGPCNQQGAVESIKQVVNHTPVIPGTPQKVIMQQEKRGRGRPPKFKVTEKGQGVMF